MSAEHGGSFGLLPACKGHTHVWTDAISTECVCGKAHRYSRAELIRELAKALDLFTTDGVLDTKRAEQAVEILSILLIRACEINA